MKWSQISPSTKKYVLICILILSVFLFVFGRFADELMESELHRFDQSIIDWIQLWVRPQLTSLMKLFTFLGSIEAVLILLFVSVGLMIWQKKRWETLILVVAVAGGGLFNLLLKWIFHRQRPTLHRFIQETGYSFPSGHSMESFVFYGMLCMLFFVFLKSKIAKVILILCTVLIIAMVGLSRIYLGVHYPSDVLAGYAAGGVWLIVCLLGLRLILESRKGQKQ